MVHDTALEISAALELLLRGAHPPQHLPWLQMFSNNPQEKALKHKQVEKI